MADVSMTATPAPAAVPRIPRKIQERAPQYRGEFQSAQPFRHLAIDDFFERDFAEALLTDFPSFDTALARNEMGEVGGKAVNTRLREIAPVYRELYDLIASQPFLDFMSELTGIPELLHDPGFYGGGTHENLHGQDLDPHVDFNYLEAQQLHRRLNLIVYLNKDWREEWGGGLEIHSNPRRPAENRITTFNPTFNRAILFETNEYSWHGFPRIHLPEGERHRSRKSLSIYLYTRERPAEEIAPLHGTFYVQRPLPSWVRPGHVLSEDDCIALREAVERRDKWIEIYQQMELKKSGQIAKQRGYIESILSQVRAPSTGYILQEGKSAGIYADRWTTQHVSVSFRPQQPVTSLRLKGWRPNYAPPLVNIELRIDGVAAGRAASGYGVFEIEVDRKDAPLTEPFRVECDCDTAFRPDNDNREVAFVLMEIRAEHAAPEPPANPPPPQTA